MAWFVPCLFLCWLCVHARLNDADNIELLETVLRITNRRTGQVHVIPVPEDLRAHDRDHRIEEAVQRHYILPLLTENAPPRVSEDYLAVLDAKRDYTMRERRQLERMVLTIFFHRMGSPSHLKNWINPRTPYCTWQGVICVEPWNDGNLVVQAIDLPRKKLVGTLPTELALLDHLKTISLRGNSIRGRIPFEFFNMTNLKTLDLASNHIGFLPWDMPEAYEESSVDSSGSSQLEFIDVSFNNISGPILSKEWNPSILSSLTYLDLSDNHLQGRIPDLSSLSNLEMLWLGNNILTGPLPENLPRNLRLFDIGGNVATGTVPKEWPLSLEYVILADNDLTGSLPWDVMPNLAVLQLQQNNLSGKPFSVDWSLWSNLRTLILRENTFTGSIPLSFFVGLQSSLRHLDIAYNHLTGTIATEIGLLRRLHTIDAMGNKIRGTLPNEMMKMDPNLRLNFTNNLITGTIPHLFCGRGAVNMLYREFGCDAVLCPSGTFNVAGHATLYSACRPCPSTHDEVYSDIPKSSILGRTSCPGVVFVHGDLDADGILSPREVLRMLYVDLLGKFWGSRFQSWGDMSVSECDLTGIICSSEKQIVSLDLSMADLCSDGHGKSGPVQFCKGLPAEIGTLTSLVTFRISSSPFLRGTIPKDIGKLTKLQLLDTSDCNLLSGTLPTEIGRLSALNYFAVSHNRLRGTLPSTLFNARGLIALHLTNNYFSGTLPSSIGQLTQLQELMISRNRFNGTIPSEVGFMTSLENIEAYHNTFSGSIPSEISNCSRLKRIDFFGNALTGSLPSRISSLVQIIHLKDNRLTGTIPSRYGSLTALSWLDLSLNKMYGTIPESLGSIDILNDIRLGGNMFYDPIPTKLCHKKTLNDGLTTRFGCDGVLCPLDTYSESGYASDDTGCTPCPVGESALYLGSLSCERFSEADILSILYEVMIGDDDPQRREANWGNPSKSPCEWDGIVCDRNGEITTISFPLMRVNM